MEQGWYSLLFAHWPVALSQVHMLDPPGWSSIRSIRKHSYHLRPSTSE
jgi:uncharacterized protein YqjF (DUF2071 family)